MKTLCDLKRDDLEKDFSKIVNIVSQPRFICKKCARVANEKQYLCKAQFPWGQSGMILKE